MLLNIQDARLTLGKVGESTLRRWIAQGRISVVRLGRRVFIREDELRALIDRATAEQRGRWKESQSQMLSEQ